MTLDEMKLAVCEKLPELVFIRRYTDEDKPYWIVYWMGRGINVYWPTEGLQVCHEAEKLLKMQDGTIGKYLYELEKVCMVSGSEVRVKAEQYRYVHATYEQRLEALCHVWFPERFNNV